MGFIQIVGKDAVTLVNFNVCCAWVSWWSNRQKEVSRLIRTVQVFSKIRIEF